MGCGVTGCVGATGDPDITKCCTGGAFVRGGGPPIIDCGAMGQFDMTGGGAQLRGELGGGLIRGGVDVEGVGTEDDAVPPVAGGGGARLPSAGAGGVGDAALLGAAGAVRCLTDLALPLGPPLPRPPRGFLFGGTPSPDPDLPAGLGGSVGGIALLLSPPRRMLSPRLTYEVAISSPRRPLLRSVPAVKAAIRITAHR